MDYQEALEKAEVARSYWSDIYTAFREDVRFSIGLDHWTDEEIRDRGQAGCMVVPVLPQFIHQVTNDERMNTPSIHVLPGESDESDVETAKIFSGLIRNIEYRSNADEVYDTAGEYAVRGGLGFARIDHDYISEDSFLQELKLIRVQNTESTYIDPSSVQCDGSDAEWGFVLETVTRSEFEERYPGKQFVSFDKAPTDSKADSITICEFFIKEYTTTVKQLTDEGEIIDNVPDEDEEKEKAKKKRKLRKCVVQRYRFSGAGTLESTTFPGKYIPIVPFYGEEVWVDGKRNVLSLIRLAKDAQRRVNKWASKESEILDMAPIAPVMAQVGAVDDFMEEWGNPGKVNVMRYRGADKAGNKLDKPERLLPPPVPTGYINAMEGAKESVKEALGMYNASIGQKSNAISGVAYDAQKTEADVATFHFADNRTRSIQQCGRILVSAIPEIYDSARIVQIIGPEEDAQLVSINGAKRQKGQEQDYDLRKGRYDVRVTTGASYTTKRQETAALLGDVIAKNPALLQVVGDLYFKNLDVTGADAMAERIKKIIPKELTADEDAKTNGEKPQDPEKIQMAQIIQQGAAEIQALQQQLQQLAGELKNKEGDQQIKQGELLIKQKELQIKEAELMLKAQQAQQPPSDALEVEKQQFDQSVKERELALKEAEFQLKVAIAAKDSPDMNKSPEELQGESDEYAFQMQMQQEAETQERELKAQQADAVIAMLGGIAQSLQALATQVAQPKQVIRGDNGMIVGVQ